jgi:hypothetical protein
LVSSQQVVVAASACASVPEKSISTCVPATRALACRQRRDVGVAAVVVELDLRGVDAVGDA